MRIIHCFIFSFVLMSVLASRVLAQESQTTSSLSGPTLAQVLALAEKTSPDLMAQRQKELQAKANTQNLSAYYFPTINAAAAAGRGLAGSGSALPGFGGVMSSPFAGGPSGDLNATWTLLDVSQGYGLTASRYAELSSQQQTRVTRAEVDQAALRLYLEAARYRGQEDVWQGIVEKIKPILTIVRNYVSVGRYNQVQLLLLRNQVEQSQLTADTLEKQYRSTLRRLAIVLETPVTDVPDAATLSEADLSAIVESGENPLLDFAKNDMESAKALSDSADSQWLPRLFATGSIGLLNGVQFVPDANYSASIGISVPVFDGFRIDAESKAAKSVLGQKTAQLTEAQRQVDDVNEQYDESADVARNQIAELDPQQDEVDKNFKLAKQRYLAMLGTVTDLQASLSNMAQVQSQMIDARMDLLTALGGKKLFNGGTAAIDKN